MCGGMGRRLMRDRCGGCRYPFTQLGNVITVTRTVKTQRDTYKGLTYAYMEKYIKSHDDAEETIWREYMIYRGTLINPADELPVAYNYNQMKTWFLGKYEEIAKFYENIA